MSIDVGYNNQKPDSSLYGVKNITMMKNPMQFANTGQNFYNHEKLSGDGMNLKHAMNRKLHLPNAMPRRQEILYNLSGRPIYRGQKTAEMSNATSRSPRNITKTDDFMSLQPLSGYISQKEKS